MHNVTLSLMASEMKALTRMAAQYSAAQPNIKFTPEKMIWALVDTWFLTCHDDPNLINCLMFARVGDRFPVRKVDVGFWHKRVNAGLLPEKKQMPSWKEAVPKRFLKPRKEGYQDFMFTETKRVRVGIRNGQVWFSAKDVCAVLGISKYRDAIASLDDDEKGSPLLLDTPGGPQKMSVISESGLYALIFKSRKAEARGFRKWVTNDVLPAIRETGRYEAPGEEMPDTGEAWELFQEMTGE